LSSAPKKLSIYTGASNRVDLTQLQNALPSFTGRPLLALTCADIGTEEVEMERKLREWLTLAHRWGAVMLIDGADIFLEKRMEGDLKRNSLVSGMLFSTPRHRLHLGIAVPL
jgi:hypothetical protein